MYRHDDECPLLYFAADRITDAAQAVYISVFPQYGMVDSLIAQTSAYP